EALVAHAIGLMEAGYCKSMVVFRSMNGRSNMRMGGQAPGGPAQPVAVGGDAQFRAIHGFTTAAHAFGMSCMRYFRDTGADPDTLGGVAVAPRRHASMNPKSMMKTPIPVEDHHNSRWVSKPFRLLDCCLETDVAAALVIVPRERAYDLRRPPVYILGG